MEKKVRTYCQNCGKITEKIKVGQEGIWGVYKCTKCETLVLLPE
ncbi:MAG: hypothetical protein RXR31_03110 [Thermoproteota archaeon]|jgi:hypothetical protein